MATYTKPENWKKGESERLRGEGDQIRAVWTSVFETLSHTFLLLRSLSNQP